MEKKERRRKYMVGVVAGMVNGSYSEDNEHMLTKTEREKLKKSFKKIEFILKGAFKKHLDPKFWANMWFTIDHVYETRWDCQVRRVMPAFNF